MTEDKAKQLVKLFDGNVDLALFYLTWIKNGLNASKAYKELHPDVDDHSCRTLGSRLLAKVDKVAIMQAYGLDHQKYFQQLKDGLEAQKSDMTGQIFPDHKTRQDYMHTLGKLLGIEEDKPLINIEKMVGILGGASIPSNNSDQKTAEVKKED